MISVVAATSPAWAQAALDEGQPATTTEGEAQPASTSSDPVTTDPEAVEDPDKKVHYGVGLRLRSVHIPQGLIELFVEHAPGGTSNVGVGVELIRRRGTVEIQFGMEFEHITPQEGAWIKKGDNVAAGSEADYILSPEHAPGEESLGWFTLEFTFLNHAEINKYVSVRYGGGAGLGILTGGLYRYDVACNGATNANPEPGCRPSNFTPNPGTGSGTGPVKYELPPVMPVVNAIIGVQIRPMPKLAINIEGGIRLMPFFGISSAYFF